MTWLKCKYDDHVFYEEHTLVRRYALRQHDGQCTLTIQTDNDTCNIIFAESLEEAEEKLDFLLDILRNPNVLIVDLANFALHAGLQEELQALEEEMQSYLESPKITRKYASVRRKQANFC